MKTFKSSKFKVQTAAGILIALLAASPLIAGDEAQAVTGTAVSAAEATQAGTDQNVAGSNAQVLTYEDCVKLAEKNNRDFMMAKLDKSIAEAQLQKASSSFAPTISIMGAYEPWTGYGFGKEAMASFASSGSSPMSSVLSVPYTARVSLSQPLITFGKAFYGYRLSSEAYKMASINFKKAGEKLKLDIISAFYGALISQELYKTTGESLKANEEYLKITKTKYANGQASNFEVLLAQVQYANSKPDLKKAENTYMLALQNLKNVLGLPLDRDIQLSGTPEYKKLPMTYDDAKKLFAEKNDDREMVQSAANMADYQKKLSIAMLLPIIALSANYNYMAPDPAFHTDPAYWGKTWDVTIGLQWTVFDGFKNLAAIKEAAAGAEKAELAKENTENMLEIQLNSLYMSMQESAEVIEAADDLIKQAEEGYKIAKTSYANGLIQSVDLMNSEIMLMRAKMNYLNALNNYMTNFQKLSNYLE